ncbi:hypothetical protein BGZ80_004747 [Entomortierella chlamydospora]|uniref:Auxin efflux carrier superfamily n=1 Tax=Entomortierella chlamydospora TaxID=101097 RepID=A0A9P6T2G7_9FUNG|nr:hypothetical protein BGZ79_006151 [Entomortierella chlamydospora]KAG0020111.1 hypothetical protein BGZ80_004747 [Entomortierella chlamydospora]
MASTISWSQFKAYWPIPVFYTIFSFVSFLVAKVGSRLLRFSKDEEKFVIASVLFSNTNTLPLALLQSLAFSAAGDRLLRDENDTKEDVAARGISYILFYAIFGNLVRWSYGFSLLVPKDKPEEIEGEEGEESWDSNLQLPSPSVLINVDMSASRNSDASILTLPASFDTPRVADTHDVDSSIAPTAFKNPNLAANNSSYLHPHSVSTYPCPAKKSPTMSIENISGSVVVRVASTAYERVRKVMTPPLLTALISLVIGLVPALHQLFMSPHSSVYRYLVRPIEGCGNAAIPMILLCLGAQVVHFATSSRQNKLPVPSGHPGLRIYNSSSHDGSSSDEEGSPGSQPPHKSYNSIARSSTSSTATLHHFNQPSDQLIGSQVSSRSLRGSTSSAAASEGSDEDESSPLIGPTGTSAVAKSSDESHYLIPCVTPVSFSLLARMLIIPVVCMPAIMFHPGSLSPILTMDPTFSLTLVLLVAAPTAINLIQICQIKGFFEMEMASVLFWSYCVLGIPCILGWSLIGLWVAGKE